MNDKRVGNGALFADIEHIIAEGGHVQLRVKGNSMRPFIRDGRDTVHLAPLPESGVQRGMVVLFRHNGLHVLHRIRSVADDGRLTIKGDGNYRIAEHAYIADVVAYAEAIEHHGRLIRYRSLRWRTYSAWSLCIKAARTLYHDTVAPTDRDGRNASA